MICVWLRQAGNVHFNEFGGFVGSDSVAGATKRRNLLDRCVAQFNTEHATTRVRIEPVFTLAESAFDIRVISQAGRETDLAIFLGWVSRLFPEVIAEWSIIDTARGGGNDVLRAGWETPQDVHDASAAQHQVNLPSVDDEKTPNAPAVAFVAPTTGVEEECGVCALVPQEDQSALDKKNPTNTNHVEDHGQPSATDGDPPTHTDPDCNPACSRCESGVVAFDDLLDPQDCQDFAADAVAQGVDEVPLPACLVLTSLELERRPVIEMMVDRSELAVMYQGKSEAVVIIWESSEDKEKLLMDPSAGDFEDCGRANLIRTFDADSSDDDC